MSWFERITRGWTRPAADDASIIPPNRWTVSGIDVMDADPKDKATYTLALATAARILAGTGEADCAADYLEKAQRLIEDIQHPKQR